MCIVDYNLNNNIFGTATTINPAWECPRCHTMNAPNTSKCDCQPSPAVNPTFPQVPWIEYVPTWPPYLPYVGDPPPEPVIAPWVITTTPLTFPYTSSTNITFEDEGKDE